MHSPSTCPPNRGKTTWQTNQIHDGKPVAKVVCDRTSGEARVKLSGVGKPFLKTFVAERDPAMASQESDAFIRERASGGR